MEHFLPTTNQELKALGWKQLDIIIVSGDAYVDHPSFGTAILGRHLESLGYKVGIIPQPDWRSDKDFLELGQPRLFFGVTAGNMDSMVNHYTAARKIRSEDAYSPDGKRDMRPDRATIIYTQRLKTLFKGIPIVIGGVEASLRRMPHYDYWSDKLRNSILLDSKADILIYGMAEKAVAEVADRLKNEEDVKDLTDIPGTVVARNNFINDKAVVLPEFSKYTDQNEYHEMFLKFLNNRNTKLILQKSAGRTIVHNPPADPLLPEDLDRLYSLPFKKLPHPRYKGKKISAYEQIKNSVTSHRGCFGGCNFCAIGFHQGKKIQSRSISSIKKEIAGLTKHPEFKGTVSDVGGPTANMYGLFCRLGIERECPRESCLQPDICPNLVRDHSSARKLLRESRKTPGVRHIFIGSGLRHDLLLDQDSYLQDLCEHHISGLLKLAPEHKSDNVLNYMNKPSFNLYEQFIEKYRKINLRAGKKQYVVPYIIVGHPGATWKDTIELAVFLKKNNIKLDQVQQFTPTPMSVSTMMYYTEMDLEGNRINVPRGRDLRLQKALIQWYKPENSGSIKEALKKGGRSDLNGFFRSA